jgi:hypothetical protein
MVDHAKGLKESELILIQSLLTCDIIFSDMGIRADDMALYATFGSQQAVAVGEISMLESPTLRHGNEASLDREARHACRSQGIIYEQLSPIQRLFLTHFRCPSCKLVPLYYVNIEHATRPRCGKCGVQISFRSSGKYGKLRKRIAFMHRKQEEPACDVC